MILQEKGDSENTIESTVCQEILKCFQRITGSDKGSLRWLMEWTVQSIKTSTWWYWSTRELFFVCFLFFSCDAWANSGLGCVLSVLFTPPGEMLFECIFHLVVSLDPEFGVHDQKVSIQEFPRVTQKGQNRVPVKRRVGVKARLELKASVRVRVRVDEGYQHTYFHFLLTT